MSEFVALLITGAVSGGIYAIFASGLVLTYVTTGVFNFAHGAIAFTVAFFYYQLHTGLGLAIVPSAVLSLLVFAPILGYVLDRAVFRNLSRAPPVPKIVATIGLLVALPNLALLVVDWLDKTAGLHVAPRNLVFLPPGVGPYPAKTWRFLSGASINTDQLVVFGSAIIVSVGLWILIRKTVAGLHMRAAVDRRVLASLRGISPDRVSTQASVLGAVLAGLAGVLIAPLFNFDPTVFTLLMFVSAAAAVIGRFRSIPLAMAGGLAIGVAQSLVAGYVNLNARLLPGLRASVPFVLLLVALILVGRERHRAAGQIADDVPARDYLADLPPWRRAAPWVVLVVALIIWIQLASTFDVGLTAQGIALGVVFLSFVVITGIGGLVSLCQGAFVTLSAFVAAILLSHSVPFLVAALAGAAVACAMGLVIALPSLRLGGLALALATLAAGFLADQMLFQVDAIAGAGQGRPLPRPSFGPWNFNDPRNYAMLLLVIFGIIALGVRNLHRSPSGRAMVAIRSSEVAAASSGAAPTTPKFVLFGVSAGIAGFGGAFLAAGNLRINAGDYSTTVGLVWLAVMVVFGVRRIGGALVAGLLSTLFPEVLRHVTTATLLPPVLFGLGAVGLAQEPDGFMANIGLSRQARRLRRERVATEDASVETIPGGVPEPQISTGHVGTPTSSEAARRLPPEAPFRGSDDSGRRRRIAAETPISGENGGAPFALEVRNLSAGYDNTIVLHDIDLRIPVGRFIAIVGPNGAGKSTLCATVGGIVEARSGSISIGGQDVTGLPAHERVGRGLVVVPEYRGIFPGLTVQENVAVSIRDSVQRQDALGIFPVLLERRNQSAQLLSGGEQQMLTLAPLLHDPPQILVVDEPVLGLAPIAAAQVLRALSELHRRGTTILLAEEQITRALEVADEVVLLELGRIKWSGAVADVSDDLVEELYLGTKGDG